MVEGGVTCVCPCFNCTNKAHWMCTNCPLGDDGDQVTNRQRFGEVIRAAKRKFDADQKRKADIMSDRPGTVRRKPDGRYIAVRAHGGPCHPAHFVLVSTFTGATSTVPIASPNAAIIYDNWEIVAEPEGGQQ